MDNYPSLQNLFRADFYQTVFEDHGSIREIILNSKKDSKHQDWSVLKQEIQQFMNESEDFILIFFDHNCDGIGIESKEEAIEILEEIMQSLD